MPVEGTDGRYTAGAVVGDYGFSSPFITNPATSAGVRKQRMLGAGGAYALGTASLSLLYTNVRFDYLDASRLTLQNYEISLTDYLKPDLMARPISLRRGSTIRRTTARNGTK